MKDLKIDSAAVINAADNIAQINTDILDKMGDVQNAVSRLDAVWDSPSSADIIKKCAEIKTKYGDARYQVMDNFVKFLHVEVGEGYIAAEDVNKALAEAFK